MSSETRNESVRRGSRVKYAAASGVAVSATVRRVHRDGTLTVEPGLFLREDGGAYPGWIGGTVRLLASDVAPLAEPRS